MKKLPSIFAVVFLLAAAPSTPALQLDSARLTRVIRDVKLLPNQAAPRQAAESDDVSKGTSVRTGVESRAELTFTDQTITRLGANTIFSFNEGTREVDLGSGAILVQVPRDGTEVKISTAAVTAAITGGTALFESNKGSPTKLLMLEGIGRFYPNGRPNEAVIAHGGEMVMRTLDGRITQPRKFNAKLVFDSAKLIVDFDPLPNADLIMAVIDEQQAELAGGPSSPPDSDNPIDVTDLFVNTLPVLAGASGKFGPPTAITAPNPYIINNGTQINLDPTITTNGVTNTGKIYRGSNQDGPLSTWLGSSPSSFDNFGQTHFNNPSADALPIAGFLFSGLQLDGNPTISNPNNATTLGLASVGGITSNPAAGTVFTFSGVSRVALVALNGSIDLNGGTFANSGELFAYARGVGSHLTLGATISNVDRVRLRAEGDVQVNAPVSSNNFKGVAGNNFQVNSTVNSNQISIDSLGSIIINNSGQLLALLNSTGGSGQVLLAASGSDTIVRVDGVVQADQGEIDIRQTGVAGFTNLNNATLHGDVVKVSALGNNGTLNIGTGNSLTADTILKLYAGGSNGTINFQTSVTLNSPTNILAAHTVNIAQGAMVFINSPVPAQVYTTNANYFNFGGTGSPLTSGTFSGGGAQTHPFIEAPPLGAPGAGP